MKAVVIGGAGHIGTYLVPRLVDAGHEVTVITRGKSKPYVGSRAWEKVSMVTMDRSAVEKEGKFGAAVRELKGDIVIDLISFNLDSTRQLVEAIKGTVTHFLHTGSIWVKGFVVEAPTREDTISPPFGDYGVNKKIIEDYLIEQARRGDFPATMINPGHIVGPGHPCVNPVGNHNPVIFTRLARGEKLYIPHFGMETLHHVHADDVARVFMDAITHWASAVGEQFFVVSDAAVTLRGYAVQAAKWFNSSSEIVCVPWEEWKRVIDLTPGDIGSTEAHISHSPVCSNQKARRMLGFEPRYTSFEAVKESVEWMVGKGKIEI